MSSNKEERKCPDGGQCWHNCGDGPCWRVNNCGPLSVAHYPDDEWPEHIKKANAQEVVPIPVAQEVRFFFGSMDMTFDIADGYKWDTIDDLMLRLRKEVEEHLQYYVNTSTTPFSRLELCWVKGDFVQDERDRVEFYAYRLETDAEVTTRLKREAEDACVQAEEAALKEAEERELLATLKAKYEGDDG